MNIKSLFNKILKFIGKDEPYKIKINIKELDLNFGNEFAEKFIKNKYITKKYDYYELIRMHHDLLRCPHRK